MPTPNETRPGDEFIIACHQCETKFDAAAASWCRCEGKLRTLICPHCSSCFCRAAPRYKETFWENAPRSLRENTNRFRIGDGPAAGGGREDVVAGALAPPQVLVVDEYLAKPLHVSVLKAALDRVCPLAQRVPFADPASSADPIDPVIT